MSDLEGIISPWGQPLSDKQRLSWLRLIRSTRVGPATFRKLVTQFGSAEVALEAIPTLAQRGGAKSAPRLCSQAEAEQEWEAVQRMGAKFIAPLEAGYPKALVMIEQPPPLLLVKGSLATAELPGVAIVGSRNCSSMGSKIARRLADGCSRVGYAIISGLARGIDISAHRAAYEARTIIVVAGGLQHIYPAEHTNDLRALLDRGAVLMTEMPVTWRARGVDFPRRNRLIAGIALGTIIVEAARRSGSLITARLANESGRVVMAIPGSPMDPRAEGPNYLIREGATLVRHTKDVVEILTPMAGTREVDLLAEARQHLRKDPDTKPVTDVPASERERVLDALSVTPMPIDDILRAADVSPSTMQLVFLELELAGKLVRESGQRVALTTVDDLEVPSD